jgi:hypothetical protein
LIDLAHLVIGDFHSRPPPCKTSTFCKASKDAAECDRLKFVEASLYAAAEIALLSLQGSPTDSDESYAPQDAAMDVRDKVVRAVEAAAHYGVSSTTALKWAKNANIPCARTSTKRISDKVRDKVLKAVEGGMSYRQAAAHCGVSLASAIRWTKHLRT